MCKYRKLEKHHFYWPRKKFPDKLHRARVVWLKRSVHVTYHHHFMKHCQEPMNRQCIREFCRFCGICCYYMSDERITPNRGERG